MAATSNILSKLSRGDLLLVMIDALIPPLTMSDAYTYKLLTETDARPTYYWDLDYARSRMPRIYSYGIMKPEVRYELALSAVKDKILSVPLNKLSADKEFLADPIGRCMAEVLAVFQNKEEVLREVLNMDDDIAPKVRLLRMLYVRNCMFPISWFRERRPLAQAILLADMVRLLGIETFLHPCLGQALGDWKKGRVPGLPVTLENACMLGFWMNDQDRSLQILEKSDELQGWELPYQKMVRAIFFKGDKLKELTDETIKQLRKVARANSCNFSLYGTQGLLVNMARFITGGEKDLHAMRQSLLKIKTYNNLDKDAGAKGARGLLALDALRCGSKSRAQSLLIEESFSIDEDNVLSNILYAAACVRILEPAEYKRYFDVKVLEDLYGKMASLPLLQRLIADVLATIPDRKDHKRWVRGDNWPESLLDVTQLVEKMPNWALRLQALETLAGNSAAKTKQKRLCWVLHLQSDSVEAYEEAMTAKGVWGRRKKISLDNLTKNSTEMTWLTTEDRKIISYVAMDRYTTASLAISRCCEALEGHKNVFHQLKRDGEMLPLTVKKGTAELCVDEIDGKTYQLTMNKVKDPSTLRNNVHLQLRGNELTFYRFNTRELQILEILKGGLSFPKEDVSRVLSLTRSNLNIPVRADNLKAEEVEPDSTPVIQLEQTSAGFTGVVGVRPFGREDSMFFPLGAGPQAPLVAMPILDENGVPMEGVTRNVRVRRDFESENKMLDDLVAACPTLSENLDVNRWVTDDLEQVLALLEELRSSGKHNRVEWPKGHKVRLVGNLTPRDIKVNIKASAMDWFEMDGRCQLDEGRYITLNAMLSGLKGSRFVELGEGEYVALTEELRRRLSRLTYACSDTKRSKLRVNGMTSSLVDDCLQDMDVDVCDSWLKNVHRMEEAYATQPKLPGLLKAELRDYQREGFEWMQRLAIWGAGACLADDMGLGKTVQSIAVMLKQAGKGPCLVVAPTSVCGNWELELERFAPNLVPHRFSASDRVELVKGLGPNDVLIAGYGLVPKVGEELASREWSMIVFDEAQALKNPQTKRTKVCRQLKGDFRLALTGTPIENRLEDLWSIFSIINPGLLGSWDSFNRRFGRAVRGSDAARTLRALIRPFLLRRLKSAVLEELPEKTEVNLVVTPNEKEMAFYERLRRETVEKIAAGGEGEDHRFEVLAALTRLRRACCHPGLADPDMMNLEKYSSKTELFLETVESLLDGGHKVLAFSQFTSYLAMIRDALDEKGISWQYLDGSTPEKDRRARVAAFQSGEGDVFLLSLKAGGTGINLTAADYVIHLDPWWNPAVEDQASDRAHRIGQKRPVTIYRMVQQGSVEEKILTLHATKRELAADFLEGTDTSVRTLTVEELINLMR